MTPDTTSIIDRKDETTGMTPREAATWMLTQIRQGEPPAGDRVDKLLLGNSYDAGCIHMLVRSDMDRNDNDLLQAGNTLGNFHASRQSAADKLAEAARAIQNELAWVNENLDLMPDDLAEAQNRLADALAEYDAGKGAEK